MTREEIESAVGFVGKCMAALGAVGGFIVVMIPRCRRLISAYLAASDLAIVFGRDAGKVLKNLLVAQGRSISQTQAMIEATNQAIDLGVYVCDASGKCISVNATLEQWFGLSNEKCLGFGWLAAIVNREDAYTNWKFAVDNQIPYQDEYEIENVETKHRIKASTKAVKIAIDGGVAFVGFVRKL